MSLLDLPKEIFQYMNFNPLDKARLRATCRGLREKVIPNHVTFEYCTERQFQIHVPEHVFRFFILDGERIDYLIRLMVLYGNGDTDMLDWCLERGAKVTGKLFKMVALNGTIPQLEWAANHGIRFWAAPGFCEVLLDNLVAADRLDQIALILYQRLFNETFFDKDYWDSYVMHLACIHRKKRVFEWTLTLIAPTKRIVAYCIRQNYVDFVELMLKSNHNIEIGQDELDLVSSDEMRDLLRKKRIKPV
jgi:hypothetical protein